MLSSNFKTAISSLKSVKWRSLLTIMAIAIGIVSVVTIVSLGSGIKKQIDNQTKRSGKDLITIRPGQALKRDKNGKVSSVNLAYGYGFGVGSLNDNDLAVVSGTQNVAKTAPLNLVSGSLKTDETEYSNGLIIGTSSSLSEIINQKVEFGSFFSEGEIGLHEAIIGKDIAEHLFKENVPIGRTLTIRGQDFIVRGIFEKFQPNTLVLGADFNKAVFIPYKISRDINDNSAEIVQILAKPGSPNQTIAVINAINKNLLASHSGQQDFTVLSQQDSLLLNKKALNFATGFLGAVAAIALLVAGIGIMNIMLVSVTERTREIGIRKAIGATNRQLLEQFWIESIIISLIGGLLGVVFSLLAVYFIRVFSNFTPVLTWPVVILASSISVIVGVAFGMIPAVKAARKDPIEALRYDL